MSQPTRLAQLTQLSCKIFSNVYNPTCARTGNKVLRQRLIGTSLTGYNPQKLIHFRDIQALYPQLGLVNLEEKERLDEISRRKRRGKGAPKKGKFRKYKENQRGNIDNSYNRSRQESLQQEEIEIYYLIKAAFLYIYSEKRKQGFIYSCLHF